MKSNHSVQKKPSRTRSRISEKLALAAGGVAVAALPTGADAAVVAAPGLPISSSATPGTVNWDVDGDGTNDFKLERLTTANTLAPPPLTSVRIDDLNGGRIVANAANASGGFAKLPMNQPIGATLAAAYKFFGSAQQAGLTADKAVAAVAVNGGWSLGDTGSFGFKFTNASGTHYGWGEANIVADKVTINRAFYDDTANAAVLAGVGAVPEPSSAALLAMGFAGLTMWRRRKRS